MRTGSPVTRSAPAKPSSTGGFSAGKSATPATYGQTPVIEKPIAPQKGVLDNAASSAISTEAAKKYDDSRKPTQATSPSGPAGQYNQPSYEPTRSEWNPPAHVYYQNSGGSNNGSGFITGMMVQQLIDAINRSSDRAETNRLRDQLSQMRGRTEDATLQRQIDGALTTGANPMNEDAAKGSWAAKTMTSQVTSDTWSPSDSRPTTNAPSSSHAWIWILLFLILAGGGAWFFFFRSKNDTDGESMPHPIPARRAETTLTATGARFHPGGRVKIDETPFILLSTTDSVIPDLSGAKSIDSVGEFTIGDIKVERAYLSDGKTFLERAANPDHPEARQMSIYVLSEERFPADAEEWAEFLGSENAPGFIGQANVTVPPHNLSYDRIWGDGDKPVDPIRIQETVTGPSGATRRREHRLIEYARTLTGDGSAAKLERLYFGRLTDGGNSSIQLWLGVELADSAIEIA